MAVLILAASSFPPRATAQEESLEEIRRLRLGGLLEEAQRQAESDLERGPAPSLEIDLHLELARIHDRLGLHRNTRPVAAALTHIELAADLAADPTPRTEARIELSRADYYYRAEMEERRFPRSTVHAERAIALFSQVGDPHGEADAHHRLGLIHFQRGDYEAARELFDRSLELDDAGGERPTFRGDYERHVGFIHVREGHTPAAIPHFERSLTYRRRAGAVDASLFAACTLASALVDLGRLEEARSHLLYAMMVAERLDSPVGRARNGLVLAQLYERSDDLEAARLAFELVLRVAEPIGYRSVVEQARAALQRLQGRTEREL